VLLALRLPVPVTLEVWLGVPVWLLVGVCEDVAVRLPLLDGELDRLADAVRLLLAVSEVDGVMEPVGDWEGVLEGVGVVVGVGPAPYILKLKLVPSQLQSVLAESGPLCKRKLNVLVAVVVTV